MTASRPSCGGSVSGAGERMGNVSMTAEQQAQREALAMVEERIREQAGPTDPMSMIWRAHMADLMHVSAVRLELGLPSDD